MKEDKAMSTRNFHIGDILSITTRRLVSPDLIDGVYRILNYMTGDNLFTHQIPRVCKECAPELLRQHPHLAEVDASIVTAENCKDWLAEQVAKYGEELPVQRMKEEDHKRIDPRSELADMVHSDRIIVIELDHSTET